MKTVPQYLPIGFAMVRIAARQRFFTLFCLLGILLLNGCATTKHYASVSKLARSTVGTKIVLMPLDVELSILTAGGVLEPNAEWTQAAQAYMNSAITAFQRQHNLEFFPYKRPELSDSEYAELIDLERLHGAVGQAILFHKYQVPLSTKKDVFDWTLGATAVVLKQRTGADYALFIHVRDSYSSAGRVFVQMAAAVLGVGVQGGQQIGFASLVDLNTGDIIWFNYLFSGTGDLRTEQPATKTVEVLLEGFPT